ncbi:MAG: 50S ribosomal protein L3 [Gammaproteobacteria bacterium]|nr:50S ribosomal protein L3 [Gammaproteobacteria bacterium]|tara:strand:+ start:24510 stop:25355 length:846 start_codon:yes stop_codon:yes gene_type:complete
MSLGMIGQKAGMTRIFDGSGISVPVTAINFAPNYIIQVKTHEKDGYNAVQIGYGKKKENNSNKAIQGHYKKSNIPATQGLIEFRTNNNNSENYQLGQQIDLNIFKVGEHVDITGTTIGKGFQGGVKRHHFKTQDATHGNSLSHRALGSTGQCQDPGRVFKGKKMAGQLGNKKNTIQNLVIVKIIPEDNIILVKGSVPGYKGSNLIVRHTQKKYVVRDILEAAKLNQQEENTEKSKKKTKSEGTETDELKKEENKTNNSENKKPPKETSDNTEDKKNEDKKA